MIVVSISSPLSLYNPNRTLILPMVAPKESPLTQLEGDPSERFGSGSHDWWDFSNYLEGHGDLVSRVIVGRV